MKSLVKNAADPQQVKEAGQKETFVEEQKRNDLAWVLSSAQGRRFLWGLLKPSFEISFVAGSTDMTAFNEGARNEANRLLGRITSDFPDVYLRMITEAKQSEEKQTETENENDN